jgi:hypothetical protein
MNNNEAGEVEKVVRVSDKNSVQERFFIDVSEDAKSLELIHGLLKEVNTKKYGRKLILKDLVVVALTKLKQKDLETLKESSLSPAELVKRKADQYNEAHGTNYGMYDYIEAMITTGRSIL